MFTLLEENRNIVHSGVHPSHANTKTKVLFRNGLCWAKDILGCFITTISIKKRVSPFPSCVLNSKLSIMDFQVNPVHFVVLKFIHQLPKTPRYFRLFLFPFSHTCPSFTWFVCMKTFLAHSWNYWAVFPCDCFSDDILQKSTAANFSYSEIPQFYLTVLRGSNPTQITSLELCLLPYLSLKWCSPKR